MLLVMHDGLSLDGPQNRTPVLSITMSNYSRTPVTSFTHSRFRSFSAHVTATQHCNRPMLTADWFREQRASLHQHFAWSTNSLWYSIATAPARYRPTRATRPRVHQQLLKPRDCSCHTRLPRSHFSPGSHKRQCHVHCVLYTQSLSMRLRRRLQNNK